MKRIKNDLDKHRDGGELSLISSLRLHPSKNMGGKNELKENKKEYRNDDKHSLSISKSEEFITENVSRNLSRDFINMNAKSNEDLHLDQNDIELKSNLETDNITNRLKSINKTLLKDNLINNFNNSQSLSNTNCNDQSHTIKTFNM